MINTMKAEQAYEQLTPLEQLFMNNIVSVMKTFQMMSAEVEKQKQLNSKETQERTERSGI